MKKELIALALVALAAHGAAEAFGSSDKETAGGDAAGQSVTAPAGASSASQNLANSRVITQDDFIRAAENTVNGVVSVKSYATPRRQQQQFYGGGTGDPFFDFFFGTPQRRQQVPQQQEKQKPQQIGLGSGVIISSDGYIVTNNHVIADAERLEVTLNDNRNFEATIIGADATTDLALIKIDAPDLHVIPMGKSEDLHVGEWVLAVGNPFGFTSTVTSGIVSAKARNISTTTRTAGNGGIESYIQTDAALNSGNSGGALVNLAGELVGINTAIYSQTGTYAGCSFAIPTSIVQKVVGDLHSFGTVQRAYLGIAFQELTPELVSEKGIKGSNVGIYVARVDDRSAAREAGLAEGDVIVSIGAKPTRSTAELQEAITSYSPGDKVAISYYRGGKCHITEATLRNNRGETGIMRAADSEGALGAAFAPIDEETARRLGISHGIAVTDVEADSRFARAGIREGFILLTINGQRINTADEVTALCRSVAKSGAGQDKVLFITGLYPTGKAAYYAVALDD